MTKKYDIILSQDKNGIQKSYKSQQTILSTNFDKTGMVNVSTAGKNLCSLRKQNTIMGRKENDEK